MSKPVLSVVKDKRSRVDTAGCDIVSLQDCYYKTRLDPKYYIAMVDRQTDRESLVVMNNQLTLS